jgi:pimeloyl-ACP methyl ester carboxylesterase
MKTTLATRELLTLDGAGVRMFGTYHKPRNNDLVVSPRGKTGVVFLNTLSDPRSGAGDTAVCWAEALAACGYPSYRLDLPGMGDTDGEFPCELLSFITGKGFVPVIATKLKELVDRFELSGVVVVGHCLGAVNALYAASEARICKGLILLDPYFNRPKWITAKIQPGLVHWARKSRAGVYLRKTFDLAWSVPRKLRGNELPSNANLALLSQWKQVASKGLPILVLTSPGCQPRPGQFNYLQYALTLAGHKSRITAHEVENTDHSFADSMGKDAVRRYAESWMNHCWPHASTEEALVPSVLNPAPQEESPLTSNFAPA